MPNFVNGKQSAEERQTKYLYCRYNGVSSRQANKMSMWSYGHINQYLNGFRHVFDSTRKTKKYKEWKERRDKS